MMGRFRDYCPGEDHCAHALVWAGAVLDYEHSLGFCSYFQHLRVRYYIRRLRGTWE
jgi:hypothetical protein